MKLELETIPKLSNEELVMYKTSFKRLLEVENREETLAKLEEEIKKRDIFETSIIREIIERTIKND